jgi:subfamily B ATP-binding cassette protein MsbA
VRTFFRFLKAQRRLWFIWLCLLLAAVATPPLVLAMPLVERRLIDGVVVQHQPRLLLPVMLTYSCLWLLVLLIGSAGTVLRAYLTEQMTMRLRQQLLAHCDRLSLAFSHREHSGRTMALFVSDVPGASALPVTVAIGLSSIMVLVISAGLMFSLSWRFALIVGIVPTIVAGLASVVTRPLRPAQRRAQEKTAELNQRLHESLAGIREVVAFGRQQMQESRFAVTLTELLRLRMRVTYMDTGMQAAQSLFSLTLTLVVLGYGSYLVIHGRTTLGTLFAIRSLFDTLYQHLGQLFGVVGGVQKSLASAERIDAFLSQTPLVYENKSARCPTEVEGAVVFDQVSFSYDPARPVLREVSLSARPKEMIALVGPSGAGKSTLVSLIARFYDPTDGRVLLDGVDLRDLTLTGLRSQIGIVFQDTFLFAATIRENIALGRPDADEAEIMHAARSANAWEFIQCLPDGLDTHVGERGVQLSEGQKQRVAIARAFLRDPRVLILDEPTSALDARSERLLQSALSNLTRGRTTFVIAHRLVTVQQADRIIVLDSGRIVEHGTHSELLKQQGLYRELFELQFGGERLPSEGTSKPVLAPG